MNTFSFSLIFIFGLLFGFIFPTLLREIGLGKEQAHSIIMAFVLPFISLIVFVVYPIFTIGAIVFQDISLFYTSSNGFFMWISIALFIGAGVRIALFRYKPDTLQGF